MCHNLRWQPWGTRRLPNGAMRIAGGNRLTRLSKLSLYYNREENIDLFVEVNTFCTVRGFYELSSLEKRSSHWQWGTAYKG